MRRRWQPGRPLNTPLGIVPDAWSTPQPGIGADRIIPKQDEDSVTQYAVPKSFDFVTIISTSGLSGTVIPLVSNMGPVPNDYHGVVDGIFPYLEGSAGPISGPRIPGNGVTIEWRILLNGVPAPYYGSISDIRCPWNGQDDRGLIEIPSGQKLTAEVAYTDSNAIYSYIGLRLKGTWKPKQRPVAVRFPTEEILPVMPLTKAEILEGDLAAGNIARFFLNRPK